MEERINMNIVPESGKVTVLQGEAQRPINQQPFAVKGDFDAPFDYIEYQDPDSFDPATCLLEVDRENGGAKFTKNLATDLRSTVEGEMATSPEYRAWSIGTGRSFSKKELRELFKRYAYCVVPDPDDTQKGTVKKLVSALDNFNVKLTKAIDNKNDLRGNTLKAIKTTLEDSSLPETFRLEFPVFAGRPDVALEVDLEVHEEGGHIRYYLECLELPLVRKQQEKEWLEENLPRVPESVPIVFTR